MGVKERMKCSVTSPCDWRQKFFSPSRTRCMYHVLLLHWSRITYILSTADQDLLEYTLLK